MNQIIRDKYISLIEQYSFEIHEYANGKKWSHDWWMKNIFGPLKDTYFYSRIDLGKELHEIGEITTPLGDKFQVFQGKEYYLDKIINGISQITNAKSNRK